MVKNLYECEHCGKAYVPKKRNYQKYCSPSCRVSAWNLKNKKKHTPKNLNEKPVLEVAEIGNDDSESGDTINGAGIGNAAIGTAIVEGAKHFLTHPENRPATKGDLNKLQISLKARFQPILNVPNRGDGTRPFYDSLTNSLVYLH